MFYIKCCLIVITSVIITSCQPSKVTENNRSQPSTEQLWTDVEISSIPVKRDPGLPLAYRLLHLDTILLGNILAGSNSGNSQLILLSLPLPDKRSLTFKLKETQLMAPALAKKFPKIKTYEGTCPSEPGTTVKIDHSPAGFRALIRSTKGTFYIDPYMHNRKIYYLSYDKKDLIPSETPFER